jgi:hypothetical protein
VRCPVCGLGVAAPFIEILGVPVHVSALHRTPVGAAAASRGDLHLAFCEGCGFIWNVAYDAALVEYDADYENSLDHSAAFVAYVDRLAARLVERYGLREAHVVEIGCGQADFLRRLCAAGGNRGTGYDPSYVGRERDGSVTVHRRLFDAAAAAHDRPDFVCCRHVLEHVEEPFEFMRALRRSLDGSPGTPLYFEVPNGEHQLANGVVWDMIYAHHSTFSGASLATLFERSGFDVLDAGTSFGGQYLWIEARPGTGHDAADRGVEVGRLGALVEGFAAAYAAHVRSWNERVGGLVADGRRVVLWGAGAKGVSLVCALDRPDAIGRVVDVNPRKRGSFVPGAATPVVSPADLDGYDADVVVVANPIYRDEVREILDGLGQRGAEVVCL